MRSWDRWRFRLGFALMRLGLLVMGADVQQEFLDFMEHDRRRRELLRSEGLGELNAAGRRIDDGVMDPRD